ncbi:MAG TPA: hypothetical protein VFV58_34810 [Blastocatellia bacterium]|jgi:hypothetical protein|nr:hypothetical protein [Blastocatellia bacterium]
MPFDLQSLTNGDLGRRRRLLGSLLEDDLGDDNLPDDIVPYNPDEAPSRPRALPPIANPRPIPAASPSGPPGGVSTIPGAGSRLREMTDIASAANPEDPREKQLEDTKQLFMAGTPGRKKSLLLGALRGALQGLGTGQGIAGGIGGAIAGGAYGAADPRGLREQEFNQKVAPKIQQRFAYEDQRRQAARQSALDAMGAQKTQAEIGNLQSEAAARTAGVGIAQQNAARQGAVSESQIRLNDARAKAAATGTPQYIDLDEGGGKIGKYQIFPNGQATRVGASGAAAISKANIQSREKVATEKEAGANARTAARQANKQPKQYVSESQILQAAEASGGKMTASDVRAEFRRRGYTVVR